MTRFSSPIIRVSSFFLLACFATSAAWAEPVGVNARGAGGPFLGTQVIWTADPSNAQTFSMSVGGSGYAYLWKRFRLGGSGRNSMLSSEDNGFSTKLHGGGLLIAYDLLGRDPWEWPLGMEFGGGQLLIEKTTQVGPPQLIEREAQSIFLGRLFTALEYRITRVFKTSLQLAYQLGVNSQVVFHSAELSLQCIFLIPR